MQETLLDSGKSMLYYTYVHVTFMLTLKAPNTAAADDKFCEIFPNFRKHKARYLMRFVCQQTILMKYHSLFRIFEKTAKFEFVVCCKV